MHENGPYLGTPDGDMAEWIIRSPIQDLCFNHHKAEDCGSIRTDTKNLVWDKYLGAYW
jgi:hypothetical protein